MISSVEHPSPTAAFSIKECLRAYTNDALGEMCQRWQLVASTHESRSRAIERVLQDPLHVQDAIGRLKPAERRLLHLLARRPATRITDILSVPGLVGDLRPEQVLHEVAVLGLALVSPQDQSGAFSLSQLSHAQPGSKPGWSSKAQWLQTPDAVRSQAPPFPPLGVLLPVEEGDFATNGALNDGATTVFLETLRIVEVLGPRVTHGGEMHKSDGTRARELAQQAGVSSEGLALALMVAMELRCVEVHQGRLVTTPEASRWAERSTADRVRDSFRAFLSSEELTDIRLFFSQLFPVIEEHLERGSLRRTYAKAFVARILADQLPDTWHSVESLGEAVRRLDPNVLFLEERWRSLAAHTSDMSAAWKERAWQSHEKRYFAWLMQSMFPKLGVVELAQEGRVFRVTPMGRYALDVDKAPEDEETPNQDALVIQPDFEVIAYLDRCTPDLRRKLDAFCERVRGGPVSTYRLTQQSLYRGVRTGVTLAQFVRTLEGHAQRAIPNNVRDQIATWERKVESVTIRTGCRVVECRSESQASELSSQLAGSRVIGERFVLLARANEFTGAVKLDYRKPLPASLVQEPGLILRSPWPQTTLFLRRQLADLGAVTSNGQGDIVLELTPERVNKDVEWGLHVAQLEALLREPLAARFRTALRAWCGEEAPAAAHSVTVVRFDSPEACDAVFELHDAAELVEGRLGLYSVVIKKGKLNAFKQALKRYGLRVDRSDDSPNDGSPANWATKWVESHNGHDTREESAKDTRDEPEIDAEEAVTLPSYSPRIVGDIIGDAIRRRKPLLILYQTAWSATPTVRRVNPVSIDVLGSTPSFSGFCHRLGAAREFRLARITGIRILEDESF